MSNKSEARPGDEREPEFPFPKQGGQHSQQRGLGDTGDCEQETRKLASIRLA